MPKNLQSPIYTREGSAEPAPSVFTDQGITANPKFPESHKPRMIAAFKTPTLRNITRTAPYMHNGVFTALEKVVDFYNDMETFWPPEVKNLSGLVSVKLELTAQEKHDLIAFMAALTDRHSVDEVTRLALKKRQ